MTLKTDEYYYTYNPSYTFLSPQEVPLYAIPNTNNDAPSPVLQAIEVQMSSNVFKAPPCNTIIHHTFSSVVFKL